MKPTDTQYREAARLLLGDTAKVPHHGLVQNVAGGAFVEACIFVPDEKVAVRTECGPCDYGIVGDCNCRKAQAKEGEL